MKIVAVIPAYNEEKRIATTIADVVKFCDVVVVVDDCSKDDTGEIARLAGAHVLRHIINRGQGAALQTGTNYVLEVLQADAIVHFDADGQMLGKDIPGMVSSLKDGIDVVLGSRFMGKESNMPATRRLTLKIALMFTRFVSGIAITDPHCGFRVLSERAARSIHLSQDRMAHASEILDLIKSNHLKFVGYPVEIRYTVETLKKGMTFWSGFIVLKDYFKHKFFDLL